MMLIFSAQSYKWNNADDHNYDFDTHEYGNHEGSLHKYVKKTVLEYKCKTALNISIPTPILLTINKAQSLKSKPNWPCTFMIRLSHLNLNLWL